MNTFSIENSIKFGWETFKKRPWFLIGAAAIMLVLSSISSTVSESMHQNGMISLIGFLISLGVSTLIDMGLTALTLKAHDNIETVKYEDLWHPKPFWKYLGASILTGLIVAVGLVLLIVPGVIFALMFFFVKFIMIERELMPVEALKESARITSGHKWALLGLLLFAIVINIVGALCLLVGLLVSIPVTALSVAHAYRSLTQSAPQAAAVVS